MDNESDKQIKSKEKFLQSLIANILQPVVDGIWKSKEEADRLKGDFIRGLRGALNAPDSETVSTEVLNSLIQISNKTMWSDEESINALYQNAFRMLYPELTKAEHVGTSFRNPEGTEDVVIVLINGKRTPIKKSLYDSIVVEIKTLNGERTHGWDKKIADKYGKQVKLIQVIAQKLNQ